MKVAFITGITGQDGAYLTRFLLGKGYIVHGLIRRGSNGSVNYQRLNFLMPNWEVEYHDRLFLHYGDLTDASNIFRLVSEIRPSEIYNLGAQSHVSVSFEVPEYTADVDALGTLRILEAVKNSGLANTTRFYQASTSELFGKVASIPQDESTPFYPRSPYAVAKLYAYWITVNYRESYGIYACNGVLFNHESPIRGEEFVTRKITKALARIKLGLQEKLLIGNLNAKRDWGHAEDYIEMQWLMLQQDFPEDLVISSGIQYSVRDFINVAAGYLDIHVSWKGDGIDERGYDQNGNCIIVVDPKFYRPSEVETLLGSSKRAEKVLGWKPRISFKTLVEEMIQEDLKLESNNSSRV